MTRAGASAGTIPLPGDGPDVSQIMRDAVSGGTPTALLAIIPYLTGFEPGTSLVVVGFRDDGRLLVSASVTQTGRLWYSVKP